MLVPAAQHPRADPGGGDGCCPVLLVVGAKLWLTWRTAVDAANAAYDRSLLGAINQHVERNRREAEARRHFVDDASHQRRPPLATRATQVGFALREADPARQRGRGLAASLVLPRSGAPERAAAAVTPVRSSRPSPPCPSAAPRP